MSEPKCHCGRPSQDAFLCRACTSELEQALAELPADLSDLQAVATRQAVGPLGLGHGHYCQRDDPKVPWLPVDAPKDEPWEFAPGAADQIWVISNTLSTWIRHLCETRGLTSPEATRGTWVPSARLRIHRNRVHLDVGGVFIPSSDQPLTTLAGWLLAKIDSIRMDEAAAQIYEEITGLRAENNRWIMGRTGEEVFAGRCDAAQIGFELVGQALVPVAATCGEGLYGRDGEAEVRCQACGMRYPLANRLEEMRERQINDQLARAHTIADALCTQDEPLSRSTLRTWIQRDALADPSPEGPACRDCKHVTCRLIRRSLILCKDVDDEGNALYRVGDVRARLALVQEQRGVRLSA